MSGYACQFGDDHPPATVLITWLANGATIAVCPEDVSPALINVIAVDLGVDPAKFYENVQRFVARQAAAAAKEAQQATTEGDSGRAVPEGGGATGDGGGGQDDDDPAAGVEASGAADRQVNG